MLNCIMAAATIAAVTVYTPVESGGPNAVTRWDGPPVAGHTIACPEAWRGDYVFVAGFGWRQCDDTPRDDYLPYRTYDGRVSTLAHVDLFWTAQRYNEALQWGVQPVPILHEAALRSAIAQRVCLN